MTAPDPRTPCVIGVARQTWYPDGDPAPEPLDMWEQVATAAMADSGAPGAIDRLDSIGTVHCMSWAYDDGPSRLAERLGAEPGHRSASELSGTSGQAMVSAAAERMLRGESGLALVVGAEALHTLRTLRRAGTEPGWSHPSADRDAAPLDVDEWFWPTDLAHDVIQPTLTFATLDTARRARLGTDPDDYRTIEAEVLARCAAVAAANPQAWFRTAWTPEEIATPGPDNRLVSTPYTKRMVAIMDVDMAAAVLLATWEAADALGVPEERRVCLRSWSAARDSVHLAERPALDRSPAMAAASTDALARAGVGLDDVDVLDLYSCFASSLLYACDALGIDPLDRRGLSATGGLPYHGGPGSNYTTHAVVEVVERLRERPGATALVSGVGMHMTNHVFAVYGGKPPSTPVVAPDRTAVQAAADSAAGPARPVLAEANSPATIAAYSVTHDRSGSPATAFVVADLPGGERAYGRSEDPDVLSALGAGEWVGRKIELRHAPDGRNLIHL